MASVARSLICVATTILSLLSAAQAAETFCTTAKFVMPIKGQCVPETYKCEGGKQVVGECFNVHGRLWLDYMDRMELWVIGTNHMLYMEYSERDPYIGFPQSHQKDGYAIDHLPLPAKVANLLDEGTLVFGDFRVCPMEPFVKGQGQEACVERASRLVAKDNNCTVCDRHTPLPNAAFKNTPE